MPLATASETKLMRVGHSPDPDDAFMFYALAKEKIPMQGFRVEHVIEDIESLNQRAIGAGTISSVGAVRERPLQPLDVSAVSAHAYAYLADQYLVMRSGASIGDQYGPILVTKRDAERRQAPSAPGALSKLQGKKIAVPGKLTTAYLVLQLFASEFEPVFVPFDEIFDCVASGKADFGLVIHEGQITFAEKGFEKVIDLGKWWHEETGLPLVLGLDVIRRDLGSETIKSFTKLFKRSIEYALKHRAPALDYALQFGRGIKRSLGDQFVGMYVNDDTVDLGKKGKEGLMKLLQMGYEKGILPKRVTPAFV